jgi:hypothetical protein
LTARIVHNHSSIIEGLEPVLKRLAKIDGVTTITPGRIRKLRRGNGQAFRLKVTMPTLTGFRLNARKGHVLQEVFVVTELDREAFEDAVERAH